MGHFLGLASSRTHFGGVRHPYFFSISVCTWFAGLKTGRQGEERCYVLGTGLCVWSTAFCLHPYSDSLRWHYLPTLKKRRLKSLSCSSKGPLCRQNLCGSACLSQVPSFTFHLVGKGYVNTLSKDDKHYPNCPSQIPPWHSPVISETQKQKLKQRKQNKRKASGFIKNKNKKIKKWGKNLIPVMDGQ